MVTLSVCVSAWRERDLVMLCVWREVLISGVCVYACACVDRERF